MSEYSSEKVKWFWGLSANWINLKKVGFRFLAEKDDVGD